MRAVDTNVLVRLVVRDNEAQVSAAEAFVSRGAWVSHVVLVETMWVLKWVYARSAAQIAATIEVLLKHQHLALQDADVVSAALANFRKRPALGFSDYLIRELAHRAGHLPLGTFDRHLAKLDGVERL